MCIAIKNCGGKYKMKINKVGLVVFLVAVAFTMGSVSATDVNSGMTNTQIQNAIDTDTSGTINFAAGDYTGIHLIINKTLSLVGNGANLIGSGTSILTISGTSGVSINGFNININNTGADGITGYNVYNCSIQNNNITNGDDGINIYKLYENLTISNNQITNMNDARDGISLVNHATSIDMSTFTPSTITNNVITGLQYGIFLGGNFKGTVSNNNITGTTYGMNITGKNAATNGALNATIGYNTITGIAMESPNVLYLNLNHNTINQLNTTGYSVLTSSNFARNSTLPGTITVKYNTFNYPVSTAFRNSATTWSNNNIQ